MERRIEWVHQISFKNKFVLFNCIHVFLKFRLSGFQLPSSIVSSGSILTLWFTTDFAVSAQGFKALYEGKVLAVHPHTPCEDGFTLARKAVHTNRSCCFLRGSNGSNVGLLCFDAGRMPFTVMAQISGTTCVLTIFLCC